MKRREFTGPVSFLCVSLLLTLIVSGCAGIRTESEEIYGNGGIRVKLIKEVDKSGKTVPKGYSHPWDVDPLTLDSLLASIHYRQSVLILKRKDREAFPEPERRRLVEPLRKAFARATPDQAVDFSFVHTKRWMLFQREYLTDGILFVREGALQCAFRNIVFEELADPEGTTQPFRGDPTETPYRTSWSLEAGEGQQLVKGDARGLWGPKVFHNWIRLDLSRDWLRAREEAKTEENREPEGVEAEESRPKEGQGSVQSLAAKREEIEEQLEFLEELYREGTVSALAYEKKKTDLLEQLHALPPAEK